MNYRTVSKWDPRTYQFQNFIFKKGDNCTWNLTRYPRKLNQLMDTSSCHQRNFSSNIIHSPFKAGEIPKILIPEMIMENVERYPEAIAVRCALTGRSYKFSELHKLINRFANSLIKEGFSHGEVIAVVMPNFPEFAIITLGALQADMTVTFMNHAYTPDEMFHQLRDSGSVCVVSGVRQLTDIQATIAKLEQTTNSKPIRKVIAMDIPSPDSLPDGVARFSEAIADHVDHSVRNNIKSKPNDLAIMPYSSGTTGLAKGVCLSHSNIISAFHILSHSGIDACGPDKGQDMVLGLLPFFHIYGFLILGCSLQNGAQVISLPAFKPDYLLNTLEKEKITMLFFVPPLILFLGIHPAIEKEKHLASVRILANGADLIEISWLERLKRKLSPDCILAQGYGMTETSGFAAFPTLPVKNLITCGAPAAFTEAKIVSTETGESLEAHKTGEICLRGPQIMLGYNNKPQATAEMIDKEGWMRTGDIGYYDEDNHLYIQGRLKELIKVKAFQVPPAELEGWLKKMPGIIDVAVIGVPDPVTGETPVAYVVKDGEEDLSEKQVIAFLADKVAKHKQLSRVFFVKEIPKSPAGKILRKELHAWFLNRKI